MASYDYKEGKERILDILNNTTEIKNCDTIPKDDSSFTYDNGIKTWIGSIFVDIVDSTKLIKDSPELEVAKLLRVFSSEVIKIMNSVDDVRQIGIRGDCVYGVYVCNTKDKVYELANLSFYINCLINMINKLLTKKNLPTIEVGIGVSIGENLIIKAGQKGTGINDRIWIGNAVVDACKLGNIAGRNFKKRIAFSKITYDNFIDLMINEDKNKTADEIKSWFTYDPYNNCYFSSIIFTAFEEFINEI